MDISKSSHLDRREFLTAAGIAGLASMAGASTAVASTSRPTGDTVLEGTPIHQPAPEETKDETTSDIIVETLITWGVTHAFGIVGDGINGFIEALRKREDKIKFVTVRHEEAAAFMATAFSKHTGQLGVCVATTGPGAIHLINGLYDAAYDNVPVIAITGSTFTDLEGMHFMQGVNTVKLMENVAIFDERINSPAHAVLLANRAARAALSGRGVAHLTIPKDVQGMKLVKSKQSPENHGGRTSSSWSPPRGTPPMEQLRAAADLINSGKKVAIVAGAGCFGARAELRRLAETVGAPIAKAFLAKALLPDNDPYTTGGIGHLGTKPSHWMMHNCDTVLILGTMMPWIDYYPKPGTARGVQIDIKPSHIGMKYPVEVGLTGDMKETLDALQPLLRKKSDNSFLKTVQKQMGEWNDFLKVVAAKQKSSKMRPQTACRALSDLAPSNAVFSLDCGANTRFAARFIEIQENQRWSGTGTLVSMASGVPYAVAASFAHPDRPSIAIVGDGGFAMLMAELSTAVLYKRNVKVFVLNNDAYGQVKAEQREMGHTNYGCELGHIDFAKFAESVGAKGFSVSSLGELKPKIRAWLDTPGVAVIDVQVDPDEAAVAPDELRA